MSALTRTTTLSEASEHTSTPATGSSHRWQRRHGGRRPTAKEVDPLAKQVSDSTDEEEVPRRDFPALPVHGAGVALPVPAVHDDAGEGEVFMIGGGKEKAKDEKEKRELNYALHSLPDKVALERSQKAKEEERQK